MVVMDTVNILQIIYAAPHLPWQLQAQHDAGNKPPASQKLKKYQVLDLGTRKKPLQGTRSPPILHRYI